MRISILGSGPGGYVAAIKAAQLGAQVTVIEKTEVGGTCLNWGCIPTKALVASAEMAGNARKFESYGIELRGEAVPDFSRIVSRKNRIVNTQIKGIKSLFSSWGIVLKEGHGMLTSPREISVTLRDGQREKIDADRIIIATGSKPLQIPDLPFDGQKILSSDHALMLTEIPKSLIIVGAGVIGCEFACIFSALGADVTIVEMLPRALSTEDTEISRILEREFKKKKIALLTNIKAEKVDVKEDGIHISFADGRKISAEKVLVSAGRSFNSEDIGLEEAGVSKGPCGEIAVNERMETNVSSVYAVGDVVGGFLLAHVASAEGITAVKNIMGGNERIDYASVPNAIFTSPEVASVGLREYQAEEKGIKVRTGHMEFRALAKSHTTGEIEGLVKVVADAQSDRILGVHIIGPHASDLIHEAALAVRMGLRTRDIADTIHAHPTLSEVLMEAAADVHKEAIHVHRK